MNSHTPLPLGSATEPDLHDPFPSYDSKREVPPEPFSDDELIAYLITGDSLHAFEIRQHLEHSDAFRARARDLKLILLLSPTSGVADLIEEAVEGPGDLEHPYLLISGHVPASPKPGPRQRILRIISATDPTGRTEVIVPGKPAKRKRRKMRKSLTELAAPLTPQPHSSKSLV